MENKNTTKTVGVTNLFTTLLTIAFIVLKLCKVISWSWVWVLSPIWISVAICVAIVLIGVFIGIIIKLR